MPAAPSPRPCRPRQAFSYCGVSIIRPGERRRVRQREFPSGGSKVRARVDLRDRDGYISAAKTGENRMDSLTIERRRVRQPRESDWKRMLNTDQADTLQCLERVGWSLRFVRAGEGAGPLAAVYDPDRRVYAVIDADGRLIENPKLKFRD